MKLSVPQHGSKVRPLGVRAMYGVRASRSEPPATTRPFRPTFTVHLREGGAGRPVTESLLGHAAPSISTIFAPVHDRGLVRSPGDRLPVSETPQSYADPPSATEILWDTSMCFLGGGA